MLVDQKTEGVVVPLNLALDCTGRLELANSSLSEMAVLGVRPRGLVVRDTELIRLQFEYGVSWEKPDMLPIWEAQVRRYLALVSTPTPRFANAPLFAPRSLGISSMALR